MGMRNEVSVCTKRPWSNSQALPLEFSIVVAYATTWRFGVHIYDIRATEIINTLKWLTVAQKSYFPLILSIKLCILIGYLRIFQIDRVTKWLP